MENPDGALDSPSDPMRKRGRPKMRSDEEQRAFVADKSVALFVEHGYGGTSMDQIAAVCHVSKRTLYRLFPRKIDLFSLMVDEHRSLMLGFPAHQPGRSLEEELAHVFRLELTDESEARHIAFIQIAVMESQQFPELDEVFRQRGKEVARLQFREWLAERKAMGLVDVDDPEETAGVMMDMVFGAISLKFNFAAARAGGSFTYSRNERGDYIRRCIKLLVRGLKPREHRKV